MRKLNRGLMAVAAAVSMASLAAPARAAETPFLGEVMWVGFNFCPRGWADANGQLLSISQNTALFSLLGTYYGGNGTTTFALPDLRGRVPMGDGQGGGLPDHQIGETGGASEVARGSGQDSAFSRSNATPYVVLNPCIATQGIFPSRN
jgi:microcystin-dependent protein